MTRLRNLSAGTGNVLKIQLDNVDMAAADIDYLEISVVGSTPTPDTDSESGAAARVDITQCHSLD